MDVGQWELTDGQSDSLRVGELRQEAIRAPGRLVGDIDPDDDRRSSLWSADLIGRVDRRIEAPSVSRTCPPIGQRLRHRRIGGCPSVTAVSSVMTLGAPLPILQSLRRVVCELARGLGGSVRAAIRPLADPAAGPRVVAEDEDEEQRHDDCHEDPCPARDCKRCGDQRDHGQVGRSSIAAVGSGRMDTDSRRRPVMDRLIAVHVLSVAPGHLA
jgi:hypothetical protein